MLANVCDGYNRVKLDMLFAVSPSSLLFCENTNCGIGCRLSLLAWKYFRASFSCGSTEPALPIVLRSTSYEMSDESIRGTISHAEKINVLEKPFVSSKMPDGG